ncbi:copper homeostasis membrane protein CopD [Bradyrhizobium sp.]|uniref:copper homeostasis membrane protein CopD n=1 Tax=Bradyrhizobium sp. TaxID=376 RepID=UPI003C720DD5
MHWLGAEIDGPLVGIRAIHFAATAMTTGILIFRALVADAAFGPSTPGASIVRATTLRLAWTSLVISAATGMIWFLLEAASMSGLSFAEAMTSDVFLTVVNETQFGRVLETRLVLAVILAGCLGYDRFPLMRGFALAISIGLIAAIAWTGHAGSTTGEMGILHLAADTLHLLAAAIWIGGLVSLALLLSVAGPDRTSAGLSFAREATERFSTMGIAVVAVVLATGIINTWILVGSLHALLVTGYGQLVLLKIALFAIMLLFAAANRFWWTPRLALPGSMPPREALGRIARNSMIEIALALMIFAIVGALGTLHPAIHAVVSDAPMQQPSR